MTWTLDASGRRCETTCIRLLAVLMVNLCPIAADAFPGVSLNYPQRQGPNSRASELRSTARLARAAMVAAAGTLTAALSLPAAQVRLREGTLVLLKLHNDLTTENVIKGDPIEFDVAENTVVNNLVVVPKGAVAWGEVTRVRSSGKKSKVTGFVAFHVQAVHTVDNQRLGLRKTPERVRKPKPGESEYQEDSVIRGLRERMIGAEKGKEYAAYTDQEIVVNAPEAAPAAASAPAPAAPPAAAPAASSTSAAPAGAAVAPSASAPNATAVKELLEPEKGSIDFASDPTGADIVIDGSFVGNTPSTLRVTPGRHTIEVRSPGYQPWTRTMLVGPGSHPSIRAFLERETK